MIDSLMATIYNLNQDIPGRQRLHEGGPDGQHAHLPWLHYTSLIQPVAGGEESNPRITWGKFQKDYDGREQLPVTILAHHALVDGIHIAQFYENLEKQLQNLVR